MKDFLKKYSPKKYEESIPAVELYIRDDNNAYDMSLDDWISNLTNKDIIALNKTMNYLVSNDSKYFEEVCVMVTMIIRLFMIELDLGKQGVKLTNIQIMKIIKRFMKILTIEMQRRMDMDEKIKKGEDLHYTLLKDIKYS